MQRILYEIQAIVVYIHKKFGQIIYFVVKTDNLFIIFIVLKNMEMVKMTTRSENIVPVLARRGVVACMYF